MTTKRIFVDAHGVLLDFVGGLMDRTGVYIPPGQTDFASRLGVTEEKLWKALDQHAFWHGLPECPHAWDVLEILRGRPVPLYVITRPMFHSLKAIEGTVHALIAGFGFELEQIVVASDKGACAGPHAFLVDDEPRNCARWSEWGGECFVWPSYHTNFLEYGDSDGGWITALANLSAAITAWRYQP